MRKNGFLVVFTFTILFMLSCDDKKENRHGLFIKNGQEIPRNYSGKQFMSGEIKFPEANELFKDDSLRLANTPFIIDQDSVIFDYKIIEFKISRNEMDLFLDSLKNTSDSLYFEFGIEKKMRLNLRNKYIYKNFHLLIGRAIHQNPKPQLEIYYDIGKKKVGHNKSLKLNLIEIYRKLSKSYPQEYSAPPNYGGIEFRKDSLKNWIGRVNPKNFYFYPVYNSHNKYTSLLISTEKLKFSNESNKYLIYNNESYFNIGHGCCP